MEKKDYPYRKMQDDLWMSRYCEKKCNIATEFHYHEVMEIYFLIEGKCNFFIDDTIYRLKAGDIVVIPKNILHKAYYEKDQPITRFVMNFESDMFSPKIGTALFSSGYYVKRLKVAINDVTELFRKIQNEYEHPDEISAELVKGYLASIAALIFRNPKNQESIEVKSKSQFVEAAIAYLKNNYSSNISLEDVANEVSVSYVHLSRTFKAETGFGFNEFLNFYRLRQAKFMLSECPSKSISEISYDCGFNDSNYFTVKFKNLFGITPTEFRNSKAANKNTITFFVK